MVGVFHTFVLKTYAKSSTHSSRKIRDPNLLKNPCPTSSSYIRCLATLHHAPACGQGSLLNQNPAQEFEVVEGLRCAEHHAAQWVVGDAYRQPSFFPDSLVQVFEQGTPSREHDAAVADVGRKFRRRALQCHADRAHNGRNGLA